LNTATSTAPLETRNRTQHLGMPSRGCVFICTRSAARLQPAWARPPQPVVACLPLAGA